MRKCDLGLGFGGFGDDGDCLQKLQVRGTRKKVNSMIFTVLGYLDDSSS